MQHFSVKEKIVAHCQVLRQTQAASKSLDTSLTARKTYTFRLHRFAVIPYTNYSAATAGR